jgi:hypothetical protein
MSDISRTAKILATALAGGAVVAGSLTTTASAAPVPPDPSLRDVITAKAYAEKSNKAHNREGKRNCNFYSGYWKPSGNGGCSQSTGGVKWRSNEWCADFTRYVWKKSGAKTSKTTPFAGSFYRAAKAGTGTWHARGKYVPKPGDAVLFDRDGEPGLGNNGWDIDHVGIVVAYDKKTKKLTTVEGNTTKRATGGGTEGVYKRTQYNTQNGDVVGYVSPEGK